MPQAAGVNLNRPEKAPKRFAYVDTRLLISEAHYQQLVEDQNNRCAICGQPENRTHPDGRPYRLAIDHDHDTSLVRGLLCTRCNQGLGYFADSIDLLASAVLYLTEHGLRIRAFAEAEGLDPVTLRPAPEAGTPGLNRRAKSPDAKPSSRDRRPRLASDPQHQALLPSAEPVRHIPRNPKAST